MRAALPPIALPALLLLWAGTAPLRAQVTVDEKADRIEALKQELEDAKRARDRVVAKRWDDRRLDLEAREKFNQEYDELKAKAEAKNLETDRVHEELQAALGEAEEAEAKAEEAKVQYGALNALLYDEAKELAEGLDKRLPIAVPERLQALNAVGRAAEVKKDAPGEVLEGLLSAHLSELALTREIKAERRGFLLADKTPGEGFFLRLGMVGAAYRDDKSGRSGLLLREENNGFTRYEWRENLPPEAAADLAAGLRSLEGRAAMAILPLDVLLGRTGGRSYAEEEVKPLGQKIREYVKTGGVFMYPLLIIPVIALILAFQKLFIVFRRRSGRESTYRAIVEKAAENRPDEALNLIGAKPESLVLRVQAAVLRKHGEGRTQAEKNLQEVLVQEVPRLERHLTTLSVLAAAAPLLGLLGTVSGLINMFRTITLYGINDPKMLAGGISEALVSTETGLVVALPIMLLHNFLANRVDNLVNHAEMYAVKTLNVLWPKG